MGQLPVLRVLSFALALACATAGVAQPTNVSFVCSEGQLIWPGESIVVEATWADSARALPCVIANLRNEDVVVRTLLPTGPTTARATLPYDRGWELGRAARGDTVLQAFYGDVLVARVEGVTDTARIGLEVARLVVSPPSVSVGTLLSVTVWDRDQDEHLSLADTVWVAWATHNAQTVGELCLVETGASTGVFSAEVPIGCALAPDAGGIGVVDADVVTLSFVDSLAPVPGWGPPSVRGVTLPCQVMTRTARCGLTHETFGDLTLFPLDGTPIQVSVYEPDLAGVGTVAARARTRRPDGTPRDSLWLTLREGPPGSFSAPLTVGSSGSLLAGQGDSLAVTYEDRADERGLPSLARASALLGAHLVAGVVLDSLWAPDVPRLLVDTVLVPTGRSLRILPGSSIAAVPGRAVRWRIQGEARIGSPGGDSTRVLSAARSPRPGDWEGITVSGHLHAARTVIAHAARGVSSSGGTITLEETTIARCGEPSPAVLSRWHQARASHQAEALVREAQELPAGVWVRGSVCRFSQTTCAENAGFGIVVDGGDCVATSCAFTGNELEGLFAVNATVRVGGGECSRNAQGGIYAAQSTTVLDGTGLVGNALQGLYAVGGTSQLSSCELLDNRGGGLMLRDGHEASLHASLIARNHVFGIDEAWDCALRLQASVVVGNGGRSLVTDYQSLFDASSTTLAFGRGYDAFVGPWCTAVSLDATDCWWGTATMALDSTGTNALRIFDGVDSPGRAIVAFRPWRTEPPPAPAPQELVPRGGETLSFTSTGSGPGDTLRFVLRPAAGPPARYAAVAVASQIDTVTCVVLDEEEGDLWGYVVLSESKDPSRPDRLAALAPDEILAWWVADPRVCTSLALASPGPDALPQALTVSARPNPCGSRLVVSWCADAIPVRLTLWDLLGRRVWRREGMAACGEAVVEIGGASGLPQGAYVLCAEAGTRRATTKVVCVRGRP